jgi:hypothetical protein
VTTAEGRLKRERYEYMTKEKGIGKKKAIVAIAWRLKSPDRRNWPGWH